MARSDVATLCLITAQYVMTGTRHADGCWLSDSVETAVSELDNFSGAYSINEHLKHGLYSW